MPFQRIASTGARHLLLGPPRPMRVTAPKPKPSPEEIENLHERLINFRENVPSALAALREASAFELPDHFIQKVSDLALSPKTSESFARNIVGLIWSGGGLPMATKELRKLARTGRPLVADVASRLLGNVGLLRRAALTSRRSGRR